MKDADTIKAFCRQCKYPTNHKSLHTIELRNQTDEGDMWSVTEYFLLQCLGCETVCMLEKYIFSEDYDPQTGQPDVRISIFPSPFTKKKKIEETYYLPPSVNKIYSECITAFNEKIPLLASIGLRAVVEAICIDKQVKNGTLEQKINSLTKLGYMTQQEAELLHLNRAMGNYSAHELREPLIDELEIGLEIVETALRNAYILPKKSDALKTKYKKSDSKSNT